MARDIPHWNTRFTEGAQGRHHGSTLVRRDPAARVEPAPGGRVDGRGWLAAEDAGPWEAASAFAGRGGRWGGGGGWWGRMRRCERRPRPSRVAVGVAERRACVYGWEGVS